MKSTLHGTHVALMRMWIGTCIWSMLSTAPVWAHEDELAFVRDVLPIIQSKCVGCHSDQDPQSGLSLSHADGFRKGGDRKAALFDLTNLDRSPILLAIERKSEDWPSMPPKAAEALTSSQVDTVRTWLRSGAVWPSESRIQELQTTLPASVSKDRVSIQTSDGLSRDWNQRDYKRDEVWAYQPLRKHDVAAEWKGSPIDFWIRQRLPIGLEVAPEAARDTLIRRMYFDILGLPPTARDVESFLKDPRPTEKVVADWCEKLLSSPHYGEQMAQHWLDVVRYADSAGFANDYVRGNAWRYRDYVVRAFNSDKPFDIFLLEQLAGDELPGSDSESLLATGFLRMGPWELTGMEVAQVARQRFLDDVTNSIGETFLGHALQCARCHDHKFDPVPTRDYYAIQAVFQYTQLCERQVPFSMHENVGGFDEQKGLRSREHEYRATLEQLDQELLSNAEKWFAERSHPIEPWNEAIQFVRQSKGPNTEKGRSVFERARAHLLKQGMDESKFPPKLVGFTPEQFGLERIARKGLERLTWELDRYQPKAHSVFNGSTPEYKSVTAPIAIPGTPFVRSAEPFHILLSGDPFSLGPEVMAGVLTAASKNQRPHEFESTSGRRTALAKWMTSDAKHLTARVMVNRLWKWHFGKGLVDSPNNFGTTGKKPTHPELLDYLADQFIRDGWSIKKMHARILQSEAYRRSTAHPNQKSYDELDPLRESYAAFQSRRLMAEELHDAMLQCTGELNMATGGIPCRPILHPEVAFQPRQVMGTFAEAWVPNPLPSQRNRRALYVHRLRGLPLPWFEVFNAPTPDLSCEARDQSVNAPQVFQLWNSQFTQDRSVVLALQILKANSDRETAITRCFEKILARQPTAVEMAACKKFWEDVRPQMKVASSVPLPRSIRRDAIEENTGERFSYVESLHAMDQFVPDYSPSDVDEDVETLARIVAALFNSNEFFYIY